MFVFTKILIIFCKRTPFHDIIIFFSNIFTSVNKLFMHDISHILIIFFIFTKQQKFSFAALLLLYFCNIFNTCRRTNIRFVSLSKQFSFCSIITLLILFLQAIFSLIKFGGLKKGR